MPLEDILSYLYFEILGICLSLSLSVYFHKNAPKYLKYFSPFLALTIVIEIIGRITGHKYGANQGIYNFFATFEYFFYFFILYSIYSPSRIRKVILFAMWIYPVFALANILFIQGIKINTSATYSNSLGAILIIFFCSYFFYQLLKTQNYPKLFRYSPFWICAGLLLFYGSFLPFMAILNFALKFTDQELVPFKIILFVLNLFLYSSFATACICGAKYGNFVEPISEI